LFYDDVWLIFLISYHSKQPSLLDAHMFKAGQNSYH